MNRILIVGATSAIASACARRWAKDGAAFFLVARDLEKLDQVAADLAVRGASETHAFRMDATDLAAHSDMLTACTGMLGRIDIALLAHGTLPDQAACERDMELALREFATNGSSVIALMARLANHLEVQRSGCLAVITSVAGDRGRPTNYVYGSAKAAIQVFSEGLRARLFRAGVHLIDIRPGFVDTPMTRHLSLPPMLVAQPDAVARRILAGIGRRADVLYVPAFWASAMWVVRNIPRFAFKRMQL